MANVKISALPAATSVASADVLPIVQSATTKKATIQNVSDALGVTSTVANVSPGLVYITSGTFTGVTSAAPLAITSVFNSTYDNYKLHLKMQSSANANQFLRFYTGASTLNTDGNYSMSGYNASGSTLTGLGEYNSVRTYIGYCFGASVDYSFFDIDFFSPYLAIETGMRGFMTALNAGGSVAFSSSTGHYKNSLNQYTGFQVFGDAGTALGSYVLYGYRKA